jgi:23S rRNA (cytidine1920-2'-O)/16S rRNA (cytidine1409-2'-O)-methyltransferase
LKKERLDDLLWARGLAPSKTRAQALILGGKVCVGEQRRDKPGERFASDVSIRVIVKDEWASRGAHKLLSALEAFPTLVPRIAGAQCLDVGASTGGFTDVLLQHGATAVVAVDVGYGQLVWRLQSDPRVTVMDRTNIRHVTREQLPFCPAFATCDASFISLRLILPVVYELLEPGGCFVTLVKPQFEVKGNEVEEGGVVRDDRLRHRVLQEVIDEAERLGFTTEGHADSSLTGPKGNREILVVLHKAGP